MAMLLAACTEDPIPPITGAVREFTGTMSLVWTRHRLADYPMLFASCYFSSLTPQGGSQNVIFVTSGYLAQGGLYRLGLVANVYCNLVFLLIGTP